MDEEDDLPIDPDPSVPGQDALQDDDQGPASDWKDPLSLAQGDDGDEDLLADVDAIGADLEAAGADDAPAAAPDIAPPPVEIPDIAESPAPFGDDLGRVDLTAEAEAEPPDMAEVDATTRDLEAMGRDIEDFHAGNIPPPIDPQEWAGGGGEGNNEVPAALDADFQNRDTMTGFLVEHTRKINELTRRLESERL